jgi:hypothetical protein
MLRFVLLSILLTLAMRALWRLVEGIVQTVVGPPDHPRAPQRSVPMARDPVCGTFVVPDRAISVVSGSRRLFFCSEACRDKYRARTA